jgi:hypothetical protein
VTDGTRCEDLTRLYEIEQGRFPFLVWIDARQALGCDLVSFATELERSEFEEFLKQGKIHNLVRVVRFIEVKVRGNPNGAIAFEVNQLREARCRKERYFIYRIYEAVEGQEWRFAVLQNPLAYDWPVSYTIDPLQKRRSRVLVSKSCRPKHRRWTVLL